ncbi:spexin prohormone 1-like [Xenentodon cancila]
MSLKVILLLMSLVSQCLTAPRTRSWTPQAILYLKGAQGHRSVLERSSREEGDALHSAKYDQISDGQRSSWPSLALLELLQRAVEKGGRIQKIPQMRNNRI